MIVVGICDGEQAVRSLLASYVDRYRAETGKEIQLLAYSTGEKLLKNYLLDMDLIFLEIPLRKMSGLKIAEHIKQYDKQVRIVFLTTVLSYVLEAYEVGASNYILKPLGYEKFRKEMDRALEEKQVSDHNYLLEQSRQGVYKIYFQDVQYIETSGKNTLIHTQKEEVTSTRQMKQFEQLFGENSFVRCHAGYIVNLRYFQKMEASTLILADGTQIPVSRNRRAQVLSRIQMLYGEKL